MSFIAYFQNSSTGGAFEEYFSNRTELAARNAALKLETKHRKLVRLEKASVLVKKRSESSNARIKRLNDLMLKLRDEFGGKKYNQVSDDLVMRISDHCKNRSNDGKYNYGCNVLSFVVLVFGDQFKGQHGEYDITEMTFSQAKKFIQNTIKTKTK